MDSPTYPATLPLDDPRSEPSASVVVQPLHGRVQIVLGELEATPASGFGRGVTGATGPSGPGRVQQQAKGTTPEHREPGCWVHLYLEPEKVAVEGQSAAYIVDDVADVHGAQRGSSFRLLIIDAMNTLNTQPSPEPDGSAPMTGRSIDQLITSVLGPRPD